MSCTCRSNAPLARSLAMAFAVKFSDPSFAYQTRSSPLELLDVAITSMSPSSSMSRTTTCRALARSLSMVFFVKLSDPSFAYQTTSLSSSAVAITSMSPSPSRSLTTRLPAPSSSSSIVYSVKLSDPSFAYQTTSFIPLPAAITSMSPSPSRS